VRSADEAVPAIVTEESVVRSRLAALILAVVVMLSTAIGSVSAAPQRILTARPPTIDFHTKAVGTENYKRTKITNTSGADVLLIVTGGLPDDFGFGLMPGSTCPVLGQATFADGESCYAVVRFSPTESFAGWIAHGTLIATASDPSTGAVLVDLEIPVIGVGSL
jgi:hypothetical protein